MKKTWYYLVIGDQSILNHSQTRKSILGCAKNGEAKENDETKTNLNRNDLHGQSSNDLASSGNKGSGSSWPELYTDGLKMIWRKIIN